MSLTYTTSTQTISGTGFISGATTGTTTIPNGYMPTDMLIKPYRETDYPVIKEEGMNVKLGNKKRYADLGVGDIFKIKVEEEDTLCIKTAIKSLTDGSVMRAIRLDSGTELTPEGDDIVTKVNARITAEE